jgi:preprotein translocase subunit SecY
MRIKQIIANKDLVKKILYVLFILFIFRVAAHVPIPGPSPDAIRAFLGEALGSNSVLAFLDIFSGGGISRFSIVMLGLGPYITASIMIQLLTIVSPKLEQLSKEGEEGRNKINQYSRLIALPLAFIEGYAGIKFLQYSASQSGATFLADPSLNEWAMMLLAIAGGTMFLMWLGELITEKGLGNGVSMIIFAGIVAGMPQTVGQAVQKIIVTEYDPTEIMTQAGILAAVIVVIIAIIFITEGQRRLPISYAKRVRGAKLYGGIESFLPIKLNMSGVIPIIFAGAFMNVPSMLGFFANASNPTIAQAATWIRDAFNPQGLPYAIFFFLLVFSFTFFSTFLYFKPKDVAENLQKHGGFIPGIRPGTQTNLYLTWLINRVTLWGAIFLSLIAVLPFLIQIFSNVGNIMIGGTGLLIVVGVAIEIKNQIEAQIVTRSYDTI